jgi:hypothetical protein
MTKLVCLWVDEFIVDWKPIDTAPFGRDVELAVINGDGKHALTFPCVSIAVVAALVILQLIQHVLRGDVRENAAVP